MVVGNTARGDGTQNPPLGTHDGALRRAMSQDGPADGGLSNHGARCQQRGLTASPRRSGDQRATLSTHTFAPACTRSASPRFERECESLRAPQANPWCGAERYGG